MQRCKECDKTYLEMPNLSGYFPEWAVLPSRWDDMKLGDSQSASGSPSPERGPCSPYLSSCSLGNRSHCVTDSLWKASHGRPARHHRTRGSLTYSVSTHLSTWGSTIPPEGCSSPKTDVAKAVLPSAGQAVPHPLCRMFFPMPLMHSVFMPNRLAPVHGHSCLLKLSWTLNKS